ncbi:MAG: hypothetical protein WD696_17155 [Bryobacteraceae bacterium]
MRSASRASAGSVFLAGEKLRIILTNVKPEKVFWVFNEKEVREGNVEVEHAFPYDAAAGRGIKRFHRVDAFYKQGGSYQVVTSQIETDNIDFAAFLRTGESLQLSASPVLKASGITWNLENASLSTLDDGKFQVRLQFPLKRTASSANVTADIQQAAVSNALGAPGNTRWADLQKDTFLSLQFWNKITGERLTMLRSVASAQ